MTSGLMSAMCKALPSGSAQIGDLQRSLTTGNATVGIVRSGSSTENRIGAGSLTSGCYFGPEGLVHSVVHRLRFPISLKRG